jgi:hypothetical protein
MNAVFFATFAVYDFHLCRHRVKSLNRKGRKENPQKSQGF